MTQDIVAISQRTCFQVAMILAIIADALQIVVFPLFVEGAVSPADDILDLGYRSRAGSPSWVALGISAVVFGQAGARSRFGAVLDVSGRKRLSEIEAHRGCRRREP